MHVFELEVEVLANHGYLDELKLYQLRDPRLLLLLLFLFLLATCRNVPGFATRGAAFVLWKYKSLSDDTEVQLVGA